MTSSGILVFRKTSEEIEFFLVHPGGPFFMKKNEGFWTIPKGLFNENENPLEAGKREFAEETGFELNFEIEDFIPLGTVTQKGGKLVYGFAIELDLDENAAVSNTFELEWPPNRVKRSNFRR